MSERKSFLFLLFQYLRSSPRFREISLFINFNSSKNPTTYCITKNKSRTPKNRAIIISKSEVVLSSSFIYGVFRFLAVSIFSGNEIFVGF